MPISTFHSTHSTAQQIVAKTTLDTPVTKDWKVRQVLIHLFFWEKEALKSIDAYIQGSEYSYPQFTDDTIDEINQQSQERYMHLSDDEVLDEWNAVHDQLADAFSKAMEMKPDGQVLCPWNEYATIEEFIQEMEGHEEEHIEKIKKITNYEKSK